MAGRRGGRVGLTAHIPNTALTSGARIVDLVALPWYLYIPIRIIRYAFRHWYVSLAIATYFLLGPLYSGIALILVPTLIYFYVWAYNPSSSPRATLLAACYLVRSKIRWRRACEAATLNDGRRVPPLISLLHQRPPRIANQRGSSLEFLIDLQSVGMTTRHLEDNKDYLAATLGARRTRTHRLTPGLARLILEWDSSPIQRRYSRSTKSQLLQEHQERNIQNESQLPVIQLDLDVTLELDTSLLVVGKSGAGKSNLTWHMLNELNTYQIAYRLSIIDPKKVELADLVHSPNTKRYSDSPSTADSIIEAFYDDMMATFDRMKTLNLKKVRLGNNPNYGEEPLNILIIDELLLTKQAKQGIDNHLGEILSAGRAAGYIVIANSQLGQVDAISRIRDLFPQRACMAVNSQDLTNAVLGPRAEDRGARCTEITTPGVGYIYTDHAGTFARFHPPYITDTKSVAAGTPIIPHTANPNRIRFHKPKTTNKDNP